MMGFLTGLLDSGVLGGVTGLIGSGLTAFASYKQAKLEKEFQVKQAELDMDMVRLEGEVAVKVQESKTAAEIDIAEMKAFETSQQLGNVSMFDKSYMDNLPSWAATVISLMLAGVDVLRGVIRPVLTIYLTAASTWLVWLTYKINSQAFGLEVNTIVSTITYLTVTSVTWWFADRRLAKSMLKK